MPSRAVRRDADSPPSTSQGGSSDGAKANVDRRTKAYVDSLLAKLDKEGVEINGKIASVVEDGVARVRVEAVRKNNAPIKIPISDVIEVAVFSAILGFTVAVEVFERAIRKRLEKMERRD